MSSTINLLHSIQVAPNGLTLLELLGRNPDIARRTAQRAVSRLLEEGRVMAIGNGRARRYFAVGVAEAVAQFSEEDALPSYIPVSADSQDILDYVNQPVEARKPVGYQQDF